MKYVTSSQPIRQIQRGVEWNEEAYFFVFCLLILSGCSYSTGNTSNSVLIALNMPPSVEVVVNNTDFPTRQGSYCWNYRNVGECVDMRSPTEILTEEDAIQVSPGETIFLKVGREPIEQGLNIVTDEELVTVEVKDNSFIAPLEKGKYIYLYFARWDDNGTGTSGDSSNAFKIEVK